MAATKMHRAAAGLGVLLTLAGPALAQPPPGPVVPGVGAVSNPAIYVELAGRR